MASNQPPDQQPGSAVPGPPGGGVPDEQLLAAFRHLLGHELPNQMIALQGLLRILEADEAERLAPAGRDLLQRVGHLAQRVHEIVQRMAELCRLRYNFEAGDELAVTELAGEAAAEVSQLSPGRTIEYDFPAAELRLTAPRLLLRRALVELVKWMIEAESGGELSRIRFEASDRAGAAELRIVNRGGRLGPEALRTLRQVLVEEVPAAAAVQLNLFFVRQVIERGGGAIAVDSEGDQGVSVSIRWPAGK